MSRNYSANQLEREFRPTRLGNWEVPACRAQQPQRPRARKSATRIIANDRGHLLPGEPRPEANPWGSYTGTWQLPNKISKKFASELSRPCGVLTSWEKRSAHVPIIEPTKLPPARPKATRSRLESNPLKLLEVKEVEHRLSPLPINDRHPYDKHHEHDYSRNLDRDRATQVVNTSQAVQEDIERYAKGVHSSEPRPRDPSPPDSGVDSGVGSESPRPLPGPPLASVYCSAQLAKNLALDNQKHQPLPDNIEDALYRSQQLKGEKHPGMGLNVEPRAAAVGVKGYGAPAPTQCSKLKVYRPKTAAGGHGNRRYSKELQRPKTSQPKRQEHMSEIELALCWDFKPVDPGDEPKRSPHIDGSNGSAAPAVFGLVHHPTPPPDEFHSTHHQDPIERCTDKQHSHDSGRGSGGRGEKERSRPKTAWGSDDSKSRHIHERMRKFQDRANPSAVMDIINNNTKENNSPNIFPSEVRKDPGQSHHRRKSVSGQNSLKSSELDSQKLSKVKHYQSSPNLSMNGEHKNGNEERTNCNGKSKLLNSRPCVACDLKSSPPGSEDAKRPKSEYKMAFKAGRPNNGSGNGSLNSSQELSSGVSRSQHSTKPVHVPKMKAPFAKKSYSIGTLAPPFSLWPGTTGQDYPEHWRLASVYQHSYKPVELRRKPLLQSVYQ